jgi:elongation factor Ts
MSIGTAQIKELREKTGAGILDCKEALETSGGDMEKASEILREKGLTEASKRSDREAHNGVLELYNHGDGRVGVMVEVNCETDFVARTNEFRAFAHEVALQIAANIPQYIRVEDVPEEVIAQERESYRELALQEGKPEKIVEKIVEGRLQKFYEESCLLLQKYIRDDQKSVEEVLKETIATIGENIIIRRFVRWEVGKEG